MEQYNHIERVVMETGTLFNDREHIIYVNGETTEDSDIGKLMHDFRVSDPNEMYFKQLSDTARHFKEEGGKPKMCKLIEEMRKEEREEGFLEAIKKLLEKFTAAEIAEMGFSEDAISLAQKKYNP